MTSATLYREGANLDGLLAALDAEHPGRVRVVEVNHCREGGVLGFFAHPRVGVHYELIDNHADSHPAAEPAGSLDGYPAAKHDRGFDEPGTDAGDALDELIRAADAADAAESPESRPGRRTVSPSRRLVRTPAIDTDGAAAADDPAGPNAEFARLLLELAAGKTADKAANETVNAPVPKPAAEHPFEPGLPALGARPETSGTEGPTRSPVTPPAVRATAPAPVVPAPVPSPIPTPAVPKAAAAPLTDLGLRRRLAEIGVPIERIPDTAHHKYAIVESLVNQLAPVPALPSAPGSIIVVAGPAASASAAAEMIRDHIGAAVWPADTDAFGSDRCDDGASVLCDPWQAGVAASAHRLAGGRPAVAIVATDDDPAAAAALVKALAPDALWLDVDATRKPADTRRMLAEFGTPSALTIHNAARTSSPASIWELDTPIALVDGRPSTRSNWAVLLLDALAALEV